MKSIQANTVLTYCSHVCAKKTAAFYYKTYGTLKNCHFYDAKRQTFGRFCGDVTGVEAVTALEEILIARPYFELFFTVGEALPLFPYSAFDAPPFDWSKVSGSCE